MTDSTRQSPKFTAVLLGHLSVPGSALGLVLFWFALGSSLLPRSAMMQGVVSALSLAFGYAVGVLAWFLIRWIFGLFHVDLDRDLFPSWVRWVLLGLFVAILVATLVLWPSWQTAQGQLVGVDPVGFVDGLKAAGWTLLITAVLLGIGRAIRWLVWRIDVALEHRMSVMIARGVTTAIVFGIIGATYYFIASSGLAEFANNHFAPSDADTLAGITQPTGAEVSGSPDSIVAWDDLGYQGRTFAGAATTVEDITAYYGSADGVRAPIRVYAGLNSAASAAERAHLVVEELKRTGAADRSVIALVAVTGTGWVDPMSAAAFEYMWKGDTAIAAMQYSFLPSWISFVLDTATATEAGVIINEAVVDWWKTLPENDRPRLVAFGESLGSLGSEAAYARPTFDDSLAYIQDSVDGALWVGPTDANLVRSQFLAARDPSSPVWHPVYDGGRIVRLANAPGQLDPNDAGWAAPRVVYYHHASDPVGYWNWETMWKPQEWTEKPIGPDVPDSVRWVPFTTFTQVVIDLINGFSASIGHGHNYNDTFVEGWSIVAPVAGWTADDTARLQSYLETLALPGL